MPRLTTPTTAMIRRASHLPETSPMRQAARAELAAIRAACPTVAALYAALRCGERHARRLLAESACPLPHLRKALFELAAIPEESWWNDGERDAFDAAVQRHARTGTEG